MHTNKTQRNTLFVISALLFIHSFLHLSSACASRPKFSTCSQQHPIVQQMETETIWRREL